MLYPCCSMGIAHVKYQNRWVSLNLHALRFVESVFLMWNLQEEGTQETSPLLNDKGV